MVSPLRPDRVRLGLTRRYSKTCRRRHLKCDEVKPVCGPCTKNDKLCEYASPGRCSVNGPATDRSVVDAVSMPITQHSTPPKEVSDYAPTDDNTIYPSNELHKDTDLAWTAPGADANGAPLALLDNLQGSRLASNQSPIALQPSTRSPSNASFAAVQWFGLLASDAAKGSSQPSTIPNSWATQSLSVGHNDDNSVNQPSSLQSATQVLDDPPAGDTSQGPTHGGTSGGIDGEKIWQSQEPIELLPVEQTLFEHFVNHVSPCIDMFDVTSQFSTFVAHSAIHNAGLMNAILALAFRHLALNTRLDNDQLPNKGEAALQYYYQTLHYVQKAMQYSHYKTSPELLATALIISAYEMLDNSSNDWERHLEGVFLIQRSQVIHGESGGMYSAVWWAWLCQDTWAAFREKRKTRTFWVPQKPLSALTPHELAMRSIYIAAKIISYCADDTAKEDIQHRIDGAVCLHKMMDDWQRHLTMEFSPLPLGPREHSTCFQPIWIRPPPFAVAVQFNRVSKILLLAHEPSLGGLEQYLERQTLIKCCVKDICGIALMLKDNPSSLMSSQALFIAGMFTQEPCGRKAILELLESCRERSGWPVRSLGAELQRFWESHESREAAAAATSLVRSISLQ
ncbi:Zn(II)2Cys6 transcription factor [Aspergillus sergii]|uniref:Zn(II)2Cys6 transcription factor n=1 Tax=Aspergillus sergii TaxID=1034303 RepID=A0A5N6XCF9_9EURO|nr:Zn(II)2Cys6 transcription factor [Aspergillus sergii]